MNEGSHIQDVVTQAVQVASLPTQLPADAESSIHKIRRISVDTTFEVILTHIQTRTQTNTQTNIHADKHRDKQTYRTTNKHADKHAGIQIYI